LKVIVTPTLSMYAYTRVSGILTRARLRDLFTLLDIRSRARNCESNPSQLNDSTVLFSRIAFSFKFFTLVGFFKAFFKMAAYSSNEIVDIILVLSEAGQNYCRAKRLYRNRYPFRRYPNAMQIRRILLRA